MNKIRNKREYRFEKCHWKNATEEWEMSVDLITGELVHPAHGGIQGSKRWIDRESERMVQCAQYKSGDVKCDAIVRA